MSEAELSSPIEGAALGAQGRGLDTAARAVRLLGEGGRYLLASVVALGVDYTLLMALTEIGHLHYLVSSAISYSTGAVVHYGMCVQLVFRVRRVADRRVEFAGFIATGLLGLAVTQAVLWLCVGRLGMGYLVGKVAATGTSFALIYAVRKALLFTKPKR